MTLWIYWTILVATFVVIRICLAWIYLKYSSSKTRDRFYWIATCAAPIFSMILVAAWYLFMTGNSVPPDFDIETDIDPGPASFAAAIVWGLVYPLLYLGFATTLSEWLMRRVGKP